MIKQMQNINVMLNMTDISTILAKTHFRCKTSEKTPPSENMGEK
jgi:hypothetical protein